MTGIAYDPEKVKTADHQAGRPVEPGATRARSACSPTPRSWPTSGCWRPGIDPAKSTPADWQKAADKLKQQKDAGIVRKYYDQDYIDALGNGEVWITQAWSGDIFQKNVSDGTNFKFVIPDEGGTIWTDNMTIPITAANPVDAIRLIDFFYKPEIAASLAEYINYVTARCRAPSRSCRRTPTPTPPTTRTRSNWWPRARWCSPTRPTLAKLHYYVAFAGRGRPRHAFQNIFEPIVLS